MTDPLAPLPRISITELRKMNAEDLRKLSSNIAIVDRTGNELAAIMRYDAFITMQHIVMIYDATRRST